MKIDKSFVDGILQSEKERNIIHAIIELAHNIGLKVVAEGVETKEQYDLLEDFHCDIVQGYLISKPLPSKDIMKLLKEAVGEKKQLVSSNV